MFWEFNILFEQFKMYKGKKGRRGKGLCKKGIQCYTLAEIFLAFSKC